jgi:hypothetical protein
MSTKKTTKQTSDGVSVRIDRALAEVRRLRTRIAKLAKLTKHVAFERKFGAGLDAAFPGRSRPSNRAKWCRRIAQEYGISYTTVRTAFAGVWV